MTLKSIELIGFKSFGKKNSLLFLEPIICIVGPNGSGKSNIVEAFRFVLGEQSMKSLRGKGGIDLIFKGSKILSSSNRASVNITFDNSDKVFSFTNSGIGVSLDYDEITIGREVFTDGINRYTINGTEVRLKDVIDLLASVNIGSSGHHIISQGQADRVLNASSKDRRSMIEDALGLKIYQYRIKESERKLEKTIINMKEVQALRREIAPHLSFLKKQVEKVEKARLMRDKLRDLYKTYLSKESTYITKENTRLIDSRKELEKEEIFFDQQILELKKIKKDDDELNQSENLLKIKELEEKLIQVHTKKDSVVRSLGRIEGIIEGIEKQFIEVPKIKERMISEAEWKVLILELESEIDNALELKDLLDITNILKNIKSKLRLFFKDSSNLDTGAKVLLDDEEYIKMKESNRDIISQIDEIKIEEENINNKINEYKKKESNIQLLLRNNEHELYELLNKKNKIRSSLHSISFEEEKLIDIKKYFEMELSEGGVLIGREVISYTEIEVNEKIDRSEQEDLRRKIERIKIKIEDSGSGDAALITKEYEDTKERDLFLNNELEDLNKSIDSLRILILELRDTLDKEFSSGVEKINKQFQEFFSLMFGGGSAFLSIVMNHRKKRKKDESIIIDEDIENDVIDDNSIGFERGIEINVTLPKKRVKDLHMLSGGERSLTSIALLFAISQVNPPPFLVLDETDAALDEANSRKYGNMLDNLSKFSQLIVVTHNRETMSRANILYGVTMSQEGTSKLLSIHLEDATDYAK